MNRTLIPLLLSALLLCGCAAQHPSHDTTTQPPEIFSPADAEPIAATAFQEEGALESYHLTESIHGILAWDQDLLLFSGSDSTTLSVLSTDTMTVSATWEPGFLLMPEHTTVQRLGPGLAYFDNTTQETLVLDKALHPIQRIPAPADLVGFPLLSRDCRSLYYCTADAIRVLDLDSGISRILKEAAYPVQGVSGLLLGDAILQISITDTDGSWWTLFLSTSTGQLVRQAEGNLLPQTNDSFFFLHDGSQSILFGNVQGDIHTLHPEVESLEHFYLPIKNQVFSMGLSGEEGVLQLYDLGTGQCRAEIRLSEPVYPKSAAETEGRIWFLGHDDPSSLYCWKAADSPASDSRSYAGKFYTQDHPDYDGLAACSLLAQELSEKYGIQILIYKDAVAVEPWDYHLDVEYRADVLRRELEALDHRLSRLPAGFLQTLAGKYTGFSICLVGSAEGSPESGSLADVNGIQFMVDFDAYIVLSTRHNTEYALYHELCHLMETVVLTQSVAYDRWENLNPEGFQYDNDYTLNLTRDGALWMKPGAEYFIDVYSMSYAKEDRARLFEYAMTSGHEDLFSSPNLQRKLRQMCIGLRDAFSLEDNMGLIPWEQYLSEPLP